MPQDTQTIEIEIKNEIDDFLKRALELNKVDVTGTKQKREDYCEKLFDDITDKGDRRQILDDVVKTEDIFIDDYYLFDDDDEQKAKNICDYVLDNINTDDVLFGHAPVNDTPNYPSPPDLLPGFSDILLPKKGPKEG